MKKTVLTLITALIFTSVFAAAAPLDRNNISADAKWVFHVDSDAFRASEIGLLINQKITKKHQDKIDALKQLCGSDLTTDIFSVTLYGPDSDETKAAALFVCKYDKQKLESMLILNEKYSSTQYKGTTIHHWFDEKKKKPQAGVFAADDMIIIAQTEQTVIAALDVIAKQTQSLADKKDIPLYTLCDSSRKPIFMAAAQDVSELAKNDGHAAILKNSNILAVIADEKEGDLKLQVNLETKDEQAAIQTEQIVRGIMAFAMLQMNKQPKLVELISKVSIARTGKKIDLEFKYPSVELFELLKSLGIEKDINLPADEDPAQDTGE